MSMHAKYEVSTSYCYCLEVMAKVKVFCQSHRQTESKTDRTKTRCPHIPFCEHKKLKEKQLLRGITRSQPYKVSREVTNVNCWQTSDGLKDRWTPDGRQMVRDHDSSLKPSGCTKNTSLHHIKYMYLKVPYLFHDMLNLLHHCKYV